MSPRISLEAFKGPYGASLVAIIAERLAGEVMIWSGEHGCWWKRPAPLRAYAYTDSAKDAGRWSFAEAFDLVAHAGPERRIFFELAPDLGPRPWGGDEDAALTRLADEGLSASRIAAALPGRSRNAVIGRADRLGVPLGSTAGAQQTSRPPRRDFRRKDRLSVVADRP